MMLVYVRASGDERVIRDYVIKRIGIEVMNKHSIRDFSASWANATHGSGSMQGKIRES